MMHDQVNPRTNVLWEAGPKPDEVPTRPGHEFAGCVAEGLRLATRYGAKAIQSARWGG
jgi:hypothetical protein